MNQEELIRLLNMHEWNDIEFKEARNAVPRNAYETVSAFANTAGGHLVFGVKKEGADFEIVGVLDVDKVQNELLSALRSTDKISLIIDVKEHLRTFGNDDLLVFYIPEAARPDKPVFLNGDIRRSFIRKGGADVRCSQDELQRLMNDASIDRYDGQTVDINLSSCFDDTTISWYRGVYESKPGNRSYADKTNIEFLFELGLIREQKPTRAAVLLFGRDRFLRDMLPRPVADCQRFSNPYGQHITNARWIDRKVLDSNLLKSWQALLDWYQKTAETPFQIDPQTLQRKDTPPEYIAFRESVINVLIHQDYADHTRKPEIRHFTDRTVFWNPGDAFASDAALLEPGEKEVRNPRIVTAFRRIGLSENAGWGLRDVFANWQELGNVPPIINNDKSRKTFELVLPKEILVTDEQIQFQSTLGVHLEPDSARLFAYVCRKKELSLADAQAVLGQSAEQALTRLQNLVTQALIRETKPKSLYELAEHLRDRFGLDESSEKDEETTDSEPRQVPDKYPTSTRQVLLALASTEEGLSRAELQEVTELRDREHFVNEHLKPLLEANLLQMAFPNQPHHPRQAYLLTEAGRGLLETLDRQSPQ